MIVPELNVKKAEEQMGEWKSSGNMPEINEKYKPYESVRKYLQNALSEILTTIPEHSAKRLYMFDVKMGIAVYKCFESFGINLRMASNADFWRYMTMIVAPDVVKARWGMNDERYWNNPRRNWFGEVWWYVYLSWQGTVESTEKILLSPNCSTDTMQNLVERTGYDGTNVGVYRAIMRYYTQIDSDTLKKFNQSTKTINDSLFRTIMRLNTAKVLVVEPGLFENGEDGYVRSLYSDVNIKLKKG